MRIKIIASGSKGNSTLFESNNTKILIDAGVNYLRIKRTLDDNNIDIKTIDGILITHTHSDHIGGLASVIKKVDVPVFIKEDVNAQTKTVTPGITAATYTPDTGYNYFTEFTVSAIPYTESDNAAGGVTVTIAAAS